MPKKYRRYRHGGLHPVGGEEILDPVNVQIDRERVANKVREDEERGSRHGTVTGVGGQEMEVLGGVPPFIGGPLRTGARFLGSQIIKNPLVARVLGGRGYDPRISQFRNLRTGRFRGDQEMGGEAARRIAPLGIAALLKNIFRDKEKETIVSRRGLNGSERPLRGPIDFERAAGQSVRPERIDLSDMTLEDVGGSRRLREGISRPSAGFLRPPSSYRGPNVPWAERDTGREKPRMRRASGGIIGLQAGGNVEQYPGYGGPQQMQVRQEFLSPEVRQPYAQLTQGIMAAGTRPLQQFGPGVAGFTPMENLAQSGIGAYGQGLGPQGTRQAQSTLSQAAQGMGSVIPQQQAMAAQYGALAPQALQQAQAGAQGMGQLGARAELQGQLAGAGMRTTGAAAQLEQRGLGTGQATAGTTAQGRLATLGGGMATAGQGALTAQQQFATGVPGGTGGMTGLGAQAQQLGATAQTGMGTIGTAAQQLGQTALTGITGAGAAAQQAGGTAATSMRGIGTTAAAPEMQRTANLQDYMSQYTGAVTDPQLQQLMEFQKMQGQEMGSKAAQSGAFGGARADIEQRKLREQTGQEAAKIIGAGQQQAFESAQQAFQADRAAKAAGLGQQLSAEQAAAGAQQTGLGAAQAAQQAGYGAAQAGRTQQLQAAQQAQAAGQQGLQAQMAAQQQAAQMADVGAGRQLQALQAQIGAAGQGAQLGMQGLAAQQAAAAQGAQFGLQGQQQGFQAAQAGTQQGLAARQAAGQLGQQGFGTAANMMQGQRGALGAQLGAYGQLAGVGGQQMALGQQQQQQQFGRYQQMEQAGARQRQLQQAGLDYQRQQFQERQQYPQQQLGWMNQQLGALPYQNIVQQGAYAPQAGPMSNLMSAGVGGLGLANALGGGAAAEGEPPVEEPI